MASQGPLGPGTGSDDNTAGTAAWSNPGRITAEDGSTADADLQSSAVTHFLEGTNFGFSIPAGATINGLFPEIKRSSGAGQCTDLSVKAIKGGAIGGTNKADLVTAWPASLTYASYGGSSDLWGLTWTPADINASNFGIALSCQDQFAEIGGTIQAHVDFMRMTVYYTAAGSVTPMRSVRVAREVHPAEWLE